MAQTVTVSFAALAAAGIALAGSAAQADTWRYAFEEAMTDVQGVYAQKFKEEIEAATKCAPKASTVRAISPCPATASQFHSSAGPS